MRAVIDTNVVYAGLYSKNGGSHAVLRDVLDMRLTPVITVSLFEEYSDALRRPPLSNYFSSSEVDIFLDNFCEKSVLQEIFFLWRPYLKDPKDDIVLEAAVAAQVHLIITHNLKDFKGVENFGVRAITPMEYLKTERR